MTETEAAETYALQAIIASAHPRRTLDEVLIAAMAAYDRLPVKSPAAMEGCAKAVLSFLTLIASGESFVRLMAPIVRVRAERLKSRAPKRLKGPWRVMEPLSHVAGFVYGACHPSRLVCWAYDVWLCQRAAEHRHRCGSALFQGRCHDRLAQALDACESRQPAP